MKVILHEASDPFRLRQLCQSELKAKQRDRYRAVLLAAEPIGGKEMTPEQIAVTLSRSRQFVDEWVKRYRNGGIDALRAKKQTGRPAFLSSDQKEQLTQLLQRGPVAREDPRCVYFGEDIRQLIQRQFKVLYSLSGVYRLLDELGYSWLCPRPAHPQGDPVSQETFKKSSGTDPAGRSGPSGQTRADVFPG